MKTPAKSRNRRLLVAGLAAVPFVLSLPLQADTFYWDRGGTNNASGQAANWSTDPDGGIGTDPAAFPSSVTDDWVFNVSTLNTAQTMGLNGARSTLGITFVSTGTTNIENHISNGATNSLTIAAGGISVNSGAGTVALGSNGGTRGFMNYRLASDQSWTNNSANVLTVTGGISNVSNVSPFTLTLAGSGTGGITLGSPITDAGTTGTTAITVNSTGSGVVTLNAAANAYTGGTTVNQGTLTLGATATLGAATGSLAVNNTNTGAGSASVLNLATGANTTVGSLSGAIATPSGGTNTATINTQATRTFTVNQTAAGTFAGNIAGVGSFALGSLSTQSLTLTGDNTISGGTTVSAGALVVDGSFSNAGNAVSVTSNAALGGDGSIAGNINFASGSNYLFNTTATLDVTGSVTFGGFGIANLLGLDSGTVAGTYVLLDGTGSNISQTNVTNVGLINAFDLGSGKSAYFDFAGGDLSVVVGSAIPEPGSFALLGGIAALGFVGTRRRRSA